MSAACCKLCSRWLLGRIRALEGNCPLQTTSPAGERHKWTRDFFFFLPVSSSSPPLPHAHVLLDEGFLNACSSSHSFIVPLEPKVPSEVQDRPTQDNIDTESHSLGAPRVNGFWCPRGRVLSRPSLQTLPPSVPGLMRKSALHSTVKTSISRKKESPDKTMLNCEA